MSDIQSLTGSETFKELRPRFNDFLAEYTTLQENLLVIPNDPEDLYVLVQPGYGCIGPATKHINSQQSVNLTAAVPGSDSRIVLVYLKSDGTISTVNGTIAASPVAPDYEDMLVLAEVTLTNGQTEILASDISDVRPWFWVNRDALAISGKTVDNGGIGDGYVLYYELSTDSIKYAAVSGLGGISIAWIDLTDTDANYTSKDGFIPVCDEDGSPVKMLLTDPDTISVGMIDGNNMTTLDARYRLAENINSEADYEDYKRRTLIQNPNFKGWYYTTVSPYHYLPIGWNAGTGEVTIDSGGQRGYCAKIAATKEMTYFVHDDLAVYMRSRVVYMQCAVKGIGYMRMEVTRSGGTDTHDITINDNTQFIEHSSEITINSTATRIKITVHSNTGDMYFDNVHLGFQKRDPSSIFEDYVRGKQIEFVYYDPTNTPGEGIEDNAPVTTLKGTGISKYYFNYSVPENFPGNCDLLLAMMVKPDDVASGLVKLNVVMEDHKGIPHSIDLTDRNLTRYINVPGTVQNYIYIGIRIELDAELMGDMTLNFAISRLAGDAEDTYDGSDLHVFNTEIIPLAKDYTA